MTESRGNGAGRSERARDSSASVATARILVVGGAGFVGSNLVRLLLERDATNVLVVDNLLSSERESVPDDPCVRFVEGSIADDEVLAQLPVSELDIVFHLATYHGNQSSIANPLADHENNTLTTLKLCERLRDAPIRRLVYASAGCTVAEKTFDEAGATSEEAPVSLWHDSPYQLSKIFGEFYLNYYKLRYDLPSVKARFQNVYGPGEVLGAGEWRGTPNTVWRNVVPTFIWKALHGDALPVENGGIATRDFIYVDDICRGLISCAERGELGGVYNLGSGTETSIRHLAELINELTGNPTPIALAPAREWDRSGKRHADVSKARRELGFGATVNLRSGLERTIAWTHENKRWIEDCIGRHGAALTGYQAGSPAA